MSHLRRSGVSARRRPTALALAGALMVSVVAVLLPAAPAGAATVTVCASGCDHTSIAAAVTAADPGDTVTVAAGTYTEPHILINKPLTVQGAGSASTIIETTNVSTLASIRINTASSASFGGIINLSGFTVPTSGGPAAGAHHTGVVVNGVNATPGPVNLDDISIVGKDRVGGNESGLYLWGGRNVHEPPFSFTNGSITGNAGNGLLGEEWRGGVTFSGSTFVRHIPGASLLYHHMVQNPNLVDFVEQTPGPWLFDDNDIVGEIVLTQFNTTVEAGYGPVEVTNNRFNLPTGGSGAALLVRDREVTSVTITGNTFETANPSAIGIRIDHSGTGNPATVNFDVSENSFEGYAQAITTAAGRTKVGTANLNRFRDTGLGFNVDAPTTVEGSSNWWGCNAGPSATPAHCAEISGAGSVTVDDWIVMAAEASSGVVFPDQTATITSNLNFLNTGDPVSLPAVFEGLDTSYSATVGSVVPATGSLVAGVAPDGTFTPPLAGWTSTVTATIDGESVDLVLTLLPATIIGTVRSDVDDAPVIGLQVRLYKDGAAASSATTTDGNGHYVFAAPLPTGSYELWFRDVSNNQWVSEWHDDSPDRAGATPVAHTFGTLSIVDAQLTPKVFVPPLPRSSITGTVTSSDDASPVAGIQVRLYSAADGFVSSAATTTDANGNYTFANRVQGTYRIWFRDLSQQSWVSEYHLDAANLGSAADVILGESPEVVDAELDPISIGGPGGPQSISGTITSSVDDAPVEGIQVRLYSSVDGFVKSSATTTDSNGNYSFANRAQGTYRLWFRDISQQSWISEYFDDQPNLASATDVDLGPAPEVADAQLDPVG